MEIDEKLVGIDPVGKGIMRLYKPIGGILGFSILAQSLYTHSSFIINCPTNNCQLNSITSAENILVYSSANFLNAKIAFSHVAQQIGRPLLLFDVKSDLVHHIRDIFGTENIILNSPYNSSNSSEMSIVIVDIRPLANWGRAHKMKITPNTHLNMI